MTLKEAMKELQGMGTAQNVKVYRRHGAGNDLFGVSFANLRKLQKRIKTDHELALELWQTGNADARSLAILIADPRELSAPTADAWLGDVRYYLLADLFAGLVARSPIAPLRLRKWTRSRKEFVRQCGYSLIGAMLRNDREALSEATCRELLASIGRQIHDSPNRARHAMNMALIAIGLYKPELRDAAIAAARRIGHVQVDHGETSCETPDAAGYIARAERRVEAVRKRQAERAPNRPRKTAQARSRSATTVRKKKATPSSTVRRKTARRSTPRRAGGRR